MQSRRKLWMTILVVAIVLMILGAAGLLVKGFLDFSQVKGMFRAKDAELRAHYERNPFPSAENLAIERNNLTVLDEQLADLLQEMGRGQVQSVEQSPPKFLAQFWATQKELLRKAKERGVKVAPAFDFGFGRHMAGTPPAPQDVARLTQQLMIMQRLCHIVYDAGITELTGVGRQEFEVDAKGGGAVAAAPTRHARGASVAVSMNVYDPAAGVIPDGKLYGRWHFAFRVTAKEGALVAMLNQLARAPMFVVVSDVDLDGDDSIKASGADAAGRADVKAAADKAGGEGGAGVVAKELRVVCGRDVPLKVKFEVDVYQFASKHSEAVVPVKMRGAK
jgi:hypothetical protein